MHIYTFTISPILLTQGINRIFHCQKFPLLSTLPSHQGDPGLGKVGEAVAALFLVLGWRGRGGVEQWGKILQGLLRSGSGEQGQNSKLLLLCFALGLLEQSTEDGAMGKSPLSVLWTGQTLDWGKGRQQLLHSPPRLDWQGSGVHTGAYFYKIKSLPGKIFHVSVWNVIIPQVAYFLWDKLYECLYVSNVYPAVETFHTYIYADLNDFNAQ